VKRIALLLVASMATTAMAAPKKKPAPKGDKKKPDEPAPVADEPAPVPASMPSGGSSDKPWAKGVPQDVQDKASALYEEGNTLFGQQAHAPALEKYKAAIAMWDHPLIRFNMAVTQIRLDRILEAADDLDMALRFGDKPFKAELYQQALDYQALVKGRVGYIEAACDQSGARLMLDGKPWFDCPGTKKLRVLAGEHAIVGEKEGFLTSSVKVVVEGGETVTHKAKFVPLDTAIVLKYKYRRWIPWTMTAMGFAVGLGGVGTWFLGRNQLDQFHADYALQCMNGCEPGLTDPSHRSLAAQRDSAILKGQVGIGMMAVGGGVMLTGLILAIANRPTRVLPNIEVAPTGGGGTASVGWQF
jgi:hypothetical protein